MAYRQTGACAVRVIERKRSLITQSTDVRASELKGTLRETNIPPPPGKKRRNETGNVNVVKSGIPIRIHALGFFFAVVLPIFDAKLAALLYELDA